MKALWTHGASLKFRIPVIVTLLLGVNLAVLYLAFRFYFLKEIVVRLERLTGRTFSEGALAKNGILTSVMYFEIILLVVMVVLFGVIVYFSYARPLTALCGNVRQYKKRPVKQTGRRDEIGLLQNAFSELTRELDEEKNIQTRMIASISHDIKTPLTSVLGYSESLLKKDLPPHRVRQYLTIIYSGASSIEETLEEFDSYIEGKLQSTLNLKEIPADFIATMLREEFEEDLRGKGIGFHVSVGAGELLVHADLAKLRRVFANLVDNTVRHNQNKEALSIDIDIGAHAAGSVVFTVSDNGFGIPEKDFGHIFEPFYTTEKGRKVSGLGLSICRNIIEAHGGGIDAENRVGGGMTFTVSIPRLIC